MVEIKSIVRCMTCPATFISVEESMGHPCMSPDDATSRVLSSLDAITGTNLGDYRVDPNDWNRVRFMAMAYVWGRQDAGEGARDTGYSQEFADVYALAKILGAGSPLQSVHHEWCETGRVLVRDTHRDRMLSVHSVTDHGTTRAEAHVIPWAGEPFLPYWPGVQPHAVA